MSLTCLRCMSAWVAKTRRISNEASANALSRTDALNEARLSVLRQPLKSSLSVRVCVTLKGCSAHERGISNYPSSYLSIIRKR